MVGLALRFRREAPPAACTILYLGHFAQSERERGGRLLLLEIYNVACWPQFLALWRTAAYAKTRAHAHTGPLIRRERARPCTNFLN